MPPPVPHTAHRVESPRRRTRAETISIRDHLRLAGLVLPGTFAAESAGLNVGQAVAVFVAVAVLSRTFNLAVRDTLKVAGVAFVVAFGAAYIANLMQMTVVAATALCLVAGVLWTLWRPGDGILK